MMSGLKEALPSESMGNLSPDRISCYRQRCLENAVTQINIVSTLLSLPINVTLDIDLAVSVYQSVRIAGYCFQNNIRSIHAPEVISLGRRCEEFLQKMSPKC